MSSVDTVRSATESNRWVTENFDEIKEEYGGKMIAVKDNEVIASSSDPQDLREDVEDKADDLADVLITFVQEEGKLILR